MLSKHVHYERNNASNTFDVIGEGPAFDFDALSLYSN